jgi:3-methyl-2-oxobutanoate hydroxymethyltransferase
MPRRKFNLLDLQKEMEKGRPLTMVTAYDYPSGLLADRAEVDIILVGDSLGNVVLGLDSTVPVTMEQMLHHCRAVARGAEYAFLVGDMPFLSYQVSRREAVRNAGLLLKEGNVDGVKLEGGRAVAKTVKAIVAAGIPVMGHIGLTPQSISKLGGYRVQGRSSEGAIELLEDALALEESGCFALVLEAIPAPVAKAISSRVGIPTFGIGAGPDCHGQVLVYHDILGMFDRFTPSFVKKYANLNEDIVVALSAFRDDVINRHFPATEHTYRLDEEVLADFQERLARH